MPGKKLDFLRSFTDLDGGLNTDASTYRLEDDESPDLENMRTDPLGPISGRLGIELRSASAGFTLDTNGAALTADKPIRSLFRYHRRPEAPAVPDLLLATLDDRLLKFEDVTADLSLPASVESIPPDGGAATDPAFVLAADIDNAWEFVTIKNAVYFTSTGATSVYRTDGDTVYTAGEASAETLTSPGAGAGANLVPGTYYYRMTRVYNMGDGELGESPMSAEVGFNQPGPGNQSIQVTIPASGRGDTPTYRLYRSLVDSLGGPYYFVREEAAGTYDDDLAETNLGARLNEDYIEPPIGGFCLEHHGRLWVGRIDGDEQSIAFSNALRPEEFRAAWRLTYSNPTAEKLRGGISNNGMVFLATVNRLAAVVGRGIRSGTTTEIPDYEIVDLGKGPGALSHRVIQERNGDVYMTNKTDVWRIRGREAQPITEIRVRKRISAELDRTNGMNAIGIITDRHYRVTFPSRTGIGPDRTLLYDFQADSWLWDLGFSVRAYAFLDGEDDDQELFATEAADKSLLYEADSGNQDWNPTTSVYKNIRRHWRSKDFSLGRQIGETVQHTIMMIEGINSESNVTAMLWLNKDRVSHVIGNLAYHPTGVLWGGAIWGEFVWGTAGQITKTINLPQLALSERLGVDLTQEENANPFSIEMIAIGGNWKGARGGFAIGASSVGGRHSPI
jgi:hypothetical protein